MTLQYLISKLIKKIWIPAIIDSDIDKNSRVCSGSQIVNVSMQKYSYIGSYCTIIDVKIGKFCSIADNCVIGGASHPLNWVSTSPVFHKGKNIMSKNFSEHEFITTKTTVIKNDVWIGNNVIIKGGVSIGNGAVIGMGSVVTKNIGDYEIWAGNPAKLIKKRFNDEIIEKLIASKWWEYSDVELAHASAYYDNVEKFIQEYKL